MNTINLNARNRTKRYLLPFAVVLLAIILVGWNLRRNQNQMPTGAVRADEVPLSGLTENIPDATQAGDPEASMRQLRQLMDALRANNWDVTKISRSLLTLPDGRFAENSVLRDHPNILFPNQPRMPDRFFVPEYEPIAFSTDIYARFNRSYYKGDRSLSHPTGYVIVGWKDGRIEKVPITQVRTFVSRNPAMSSKKDCYPGMPEYATAKPSFALSDAAK